MGLDKLKIVCLIVPIQMLDELQVFYLKQQLK